MPALCKVYEPCKDGFAVALPPFAGSLWAPVRILSPPDRAVICIVKYTGIAVGSVTLPHRYGNSHVIWDHTVLPAIRQRWHSSRLYPSRRYARLS